MKQLISRALADFIFAFFAGVVSYTTKLFDIEILHVTESDFLTAFPNRELSIFLNRQFLYDGSLAQSWMGDSYWQYGPLHQIITIPLYWFSSVENATNFLFGFNFVLLVGMYIRFLSTFNLPLKSRLGLVPVAFIFLFYPTFSALNQRNLEILEIYLVVLALECAIKGKLLFSGIVVGLAAGIKFLPAIVILPWLISRKASPIIGFGISVISQIVLGQIIWGWERNWVWKLLRDGEEGTIPLRQGLADLILRIAGNENTNLNQIYAVIVIVIFLCLLLGFRHYPKLVSSTSFNFTWSFLLGLICVLPPHSNNYYFVFFGPLVLWIFLQLKTRTWTIPSLLFYLALLLISIAAPLALLWRFVGFAKVDYYQNILNQVLSFSPMFFGGAILIALSWFLFAHNSKTSQVKSL